jgi:hypothetical protein
MTVANEREQLEQDRARVRGEAIALSFMRKHMYEFHPCEANSKILGDWLKEKGLALSEETLEKALEANIDKLARADRSAPTPQAPAGDAEDPDSETARADLDKQFPLPKNWTRIYTPADVHALSPDEYRRMYHSSLGENFRKRVFEIMRRFGVKGRR